MSSEKPKKQENDTFRTRFSGERRRRRYQILLGIMTVFIFVFMTVVVLIPIIIMAYLGIAEICRGILYLGKVKGEKTAW